MGTIYIRSKQSKTLWGYWIDPATGKDHRRSLRTKDQTVARSRLRDLELGLVQTDRSANQASDLKKLLDAYLDTIANPVTKKAYEQKSRHLLRLLNGELSEDGISAFITARQNEGASRHTIHKELVVLRGALKLAKVKVEVPEYAPRYVPRKGYLTSDEVRALRDALPAERRGWLMWSVYTGANLAELYRLRAVDVDVKAKLVLIRGTKRESRDRRIPLAEPLLKWLDELPVKYWHNAVRDLGLYCRKAGVPRVTSNDLRRTFCSWLKQNGVDNKTAADLMGHKSTRMVDQVYGQLNISTYRAAIATLPDVDQKHSKRTTGVRRNPAEPSSRAAPVANRRAARSAKSQVLSQKHEPLGECPGTELNRRHADFQSEFKPTKTSE